MANAVMVDAVARSKARGKDSATVEEEAAAAASEEGARKKHSIFASVTERESNKKKTHTLPRLHPTLPTFY